MTGMSRSDAPVAIEGDGLELRKRELGGDMTAAFVRLAKGPTSVRRSSACPTTASPARTGATCCPDGCALHTGSGPEDYEAGQAFYWGPGHAPEALEDAEYVRLLPHTGVQARHRAHHEPMTWAPGGGPPGAASRRQALASACP